MPDHVTASADVARLLDFVSHHAKDRTTEGSFGRNNTDSATRLFGFRHENNIRASTPKKQSLETQRTRRNGGNMNSGNVAPDHWLIRLAVPSPVASLSKLLCVLRSSAFQRSSTLAFWYSRVDAASA
jgi:hypothetical protein